MDDADDCDGLICERVVRQIEQDQLAAEFKLAIFSSALLSYRRNSCVLPFPPGFVDRDGNKDIGRLVRVCEYICKYI